MKYLFTLISALFEWIVGINVALQSLLHEIRSNKNKNEGKNETRKFNKK